MLSDGTVKIEMALGDQMKIRHPLSGNMRKIWRAGGWYAHLIIESGAGAKLPLQIGEHLRRVAQRADLTECLQSSVMIRKKC